MEGWLRGSINTIYGGSRTGKTSLIMDAILNAYEPDDHRQVFLILDTESGFNRDRLATMIKARNLDDEILDRVKVYSVSAFDEQHEVTVKAWEKDIQSNRWRPAVLAVDSFVNFYHQALCNVPPAYLGSQARTLQGRLATETVHLLSLAQRYDAAVILVSWVKSKLGRRLKQKGESLEDDLEAGFGSLEFDMIGGQRLEYMSKILLRLYRTKHKLVAALLLKHLNKPSDRYAWFRITEAGIEDAPTEDKRKIEDVEALLAHALESET